MEVASTLSYDESSRSPAASLVPFATKGSLLKSDVRNRGSSSALITRTIACKLDIPVILRLGLPDEPLQAYSTTKNRANGGGVVKATGPASRFRSAGCYLGRFPSIVTTVSTLQSNFMALGAFESATTDPQESHTESYGLEVGITGGNQDPVDVDDAIHLPSFGGAVEWRPGVRTNWRRE
jgi:hypothetical protein